MQSNPKRPRFEFLDGLRGLSALYVVFHHFGGWGLGPLPTILVPFSKLFFFGHTAVCIFIVLSGFSLMLPVAFSENKELPGGIKDYIRRRARRIMPPYYAALFLSVTFTFITDLLVNKAHFNGLFQTATWQSNSIASLIAHVFLLHNLWLPWAYDFNMAHWSVATEWQIYFFLPLVLLPLWRRNGILLWSASLFFSLTPCLVSYAVFRACPWMLNLFVLGMCTAVMVTRLLKGELLASKAKKDALLGYVVSIIGFAIFYILDKKFETIIPRYSILDYLIQSVKDFFIGILGGSVILHCSTLYQEHLGSPMPKKHFILSILESPVASFLGRISYSLYLIHCIILFAILSLGIIYDWKGYTVSLVRIFIGIPLAVVLSLPFYHFFERPFVNSPKKASSS